MLTDVIAVVLAVALLLIGIAVLVPLAERLGLPHPVLLAAFGLVIGLVRLHLDGGGPDPLLPGLPGGHGEAHGVSGSLMGDITRGLLNIGSAADAFLYLFLPALLFTAGLTIDVRRLLDEFAAVLLLAVIAVAVCVAVVAVILDGALGLMGVAEAAGYSLLAAALIGAIVAPTDPGAVVGIFRELGAPRRLTILVEGESLFNDAAAIAFFVVLTAALAGSQADLGSGLVSFLREFVGGILLGILMARAGLWLLARLNGERVAEVTVTVALAYAAFIIGQKYFHVSGVVACVSAALTLAALGPVQLADANWRSLKEVWQQIEFWANSLIFVLASELAVGVLARLEQDQLGFYAVLLAVLVVATMLARAVILFAFLPAMARLGWVQPVDLRYSAVILWGALRGAVTLVLALSVVANPGIDDKTGGFVATLSILFVFFTLFVSAPTMGALLRLLRLNRLTPQESALRDRVLSVSRARLGEYLGTVAPDYGLPQKAADGVESAVVHAPPQTGEAALTADLSARVALLTVAEREKALYRQHFAEGQISRRLVAQLVAETDRLIDRVRQAGGPGYLEATQRRFTESPAFRVALWLHRRWGWSGPLSQNLADRFEALIIGQLVLRDLGRFNREAVRPLLGDRTALDVDRALAARLEQTREALSAIELQYSDYAAQLRRQYLAMAGLRYEEKEYDELYDQALIGREVYSALTADLERRRATLERRPRLDLGLSLAKMIARVPLFASLSVEMIAVVARELRPMLAFPGERLVVKGETGTSMYFIAAGAADVEVESSVRLGAGDFFGELALINSAPRSATVVSVGYTHLLVLEGRDLARIMKTVPTIGDAIRKVAAERMRRVPA